MGWGKFIEKYWYLVFPLFLGGINLYAWIQLSKAEQKLDRTQQEVREFITDQNIKKLDELLIKSREERKKWDDLEKYLNDHPEVVFNYKINNISKKYNLDKIEEKRFKNLIKICTKWYGTSTINSLINDEEFELDTTLVRRIEEGKQWYEDWYKEHKGENPYQKVFTKKSIKECSDFLDKHDSFFTKIIEKFNLTNPKTKELLVSLIRLESHLGKNTGKDKAFNVLVSHYVFNPRKGTRNFALKQLKYLIKLRNKIDVFSASSIMGAIGWTQGIPKALNDHMTDFDNDGEINHFALPDAVGFTLNYFGVKEGNKGTKNIAYALKWYNPHDKWYVPTILELADSLYNYRNDKNTETFSEKFSKPGLGPNTVQ